MLDACMVGHGTMGIWHSEALQRVDVRQLHTVVGRPTTPVSGPEPTAGRKPASTEEFARTGIPMELVLVVETDDDQTIVCTGSYYSREYVYDTLAVTDHDSHRVDERRSTMTTTTAGADRHRAAGADRHRARATASGSRPDVASGAWACL